MSTTRERFERFLATIARRRNRLDGPARAPTQDWAETAPGCPEVRQGEQDIETDERRPGAQMPLDLATKKERDTDGNE